MKNMKALHFFLLLLYCFWGGAASVSALQLEGVVLSRKGPVQDAKVIAYPDFTSLRNQENGIVSSAGEKIGQFRLSLKEGKYYLVATGTDQNENLYGYHGLNPIHMEEDYRWIPILVQPENMVNCEQGFQGVGGRVLYKDAPVANSSISVYTLADEPFRGMGLLTNTAYEDGTFWFDLEPGKYVVIARKRQAGGAIGPIKKGDLLCYYSGNPIEVLPGQGCDIDISCHPRDDIDAFFVKDATDPRGKKEQKRRAASLKEADETDSTRQVAATGRQQAFISGRVTDLSGLPLNNLYISAYPVGKVKLFQMYVLRLRTEYMTRTDRNGFFRLELGSGDYYLVAREKVGDAPLSGEYYGLYENNYNHSISINPGEVKSGVHIVAESIMP